MLSCIQFNTVLDYIDPNCFLSVPNLNISGRERFGIFRPHHRVDYFQQSSPVQSKIQSYIDHPTQSSRDSVRPSGVSQGKANPTMVLETTSERRTSNTKSTARKSTGGKIPKKAVPGGKAPARELPLCVLILSMLREANDHRLY